MSAAGPGPLAGLRVLDLSRVLAGPYCTQLLADLGAEVVKVERPGEGDITRGWGPPWHAGQSAYFQAANRGKRSLTLDLSRPAGQAIARRLSAASDVLVENFRPGTLARLGLAPEHLESDNPGLVLCSISGYGQDGPYRDRPGYDLLIQAEGGIMSVTGAPEGEPAKVGVAVTDITAGLFAASAILAALHERERSGRGQRIDVSLFDAQLAWLANVAHNHLVTGQKPPRLGNQHPNIVPYQVFATADGHLALAVGTDGQFRRFCAAAGRPDLAEDPRFATNAERVVRRTTLIPLLAEIIARRSTADWVTGCEAAGVPAGPVNDVPAALAHPQARARGMVQDLDRPDGQQVPVLGPVPRLSRTPARLGAAPPDLGADSAEVLREILGLSEAEIRALRDDQVI